MNILLSTEVPAVIVADAFDILIFLVIGGLIFIQWLIKALSQSGESRKRQSASGKSSGGGGKIEEFIKQITETAEGTPAVPPPLPAQDRKTAKPYRPHATEERERRATDKDDRSSGRARPHAARVSTHDDGGIDVQLDNVTTLRRAVVLHAIFSPPKALEKGGNLWD